MNIEIYCLIFECSKKRGHLNSEVIWICVISIDIVEDSCAVFLT